MPSHSLFRAFFALFLGLSLSGPGLADTLADIYELALKNDPTLQAAEADYKADREIKSQAIARLLPQVSGSVSYTDSDEDTSSKRNFGAGFKPVSEFENENETERYSVSLTQELFNLQAFFAFRQSKALSKRAELQFGIDQQSLILRTSSAYFNVLRGKDNLASALAEEKAIAQQLEQTQQRYDVGLIAITDVHEARAAYDLAVANRLTEEVNLGIAREDLTALTNIHHDNLGNLTGNFPVIPPEPADVNEWVAFTETNNLSIKLAEQVAESSRQNSKVKKAAYLPTIQGKVTYTDSSTDTEALNQDTLEFDDDLFSDLEGTTIEISADIPIFLGGSRHSERKQAGYEKVRDQANLVAAKRSAFQKARSNYLTTVTDVARVKARQLAITSAQSALDATQAGYDAGTRNIVDLLNAQRDLYRAQRDYANTRYDYIINMLNLKEAAGILSPQDIYDLDKWLDPPEPVLKSVSFNTSY